MGAWWGCCDTVLMCLLVEGYLRVLLYKLPSWVKKTQHFSVEISHLRVVQEFMLLRLHTRFIALTHKVIIPNDNNIH